MTLKGDTKFEEKLTCGLGNDMSNIANFHQSNLSLKIGIMMGSFHPKQEKYKLKIHRGVTMKMKNDAKFEEELTCHFKIYMRNLCYF